MMMISSGMMFTVSQFCSRNVETRMAQNLFVQVDMLYMQVDMFFKGRKNFVAHVETIKEVCSRVTLYLYTFENNI